MSEIDDSHEIQLQLSYSFLHLDNRSVWLIQSLERTVDLVNPIHSFQLEDHGKFLALCAALRTIDIKLV